MEKKLLPMCFPERPYPGHFASLLITAWKVSKYRDSSGPYFPIFWLNSKIYGVISVFSANTEKYGPEKTPYLDTFHAVDDAGLQVI